MGEFIMPIASPMGEQSEQEIQARKLASDNAIATLKKLVDGTNVPYEMCIRNTGPTDANGFFLDKGIITHFAYKLENGRPIFADGVEQ